MAYYIADIRHATPQSEYRYLFDANVWLAILDPTFMRPEYRPYTGFFNSIINNTYTSNAKIAVPCLLLSEVINRMIRDIYEKEFEVNHPPMPGQTKKEYLRFYRGRQRPADVENVCAAIRAYHQKIEFVSDNIDQYSCRDLIKDIPANLDINDYLFSKMALAQGLIIVTHDSDFDVEDVHILTAQTALLQKVGIT